MCDMTLAERIHQFSAFFFSARIRVEHTHMERFSLFVHAHAGLAKAGHADTRDIVKFSRHFPDDRINGIHHNRKIDLMTAQRPLYRIITIRFVQISALLVKHRTFTAGGANIQSRNLHTGNLLVDLYPVISKVGGKCLL